MKKIIYIILVIIIIVNTYSIALANSISSQQKIKERMNHLFSTIENSDLESYLKLFSQDYKNKKTNEHNTEIVETYDDLEGRFPNPERIKKIRIEIKEATVELKEEKATYTAKLENYTEYTNGLSFEREEQVEYILTFDSEVDQWLVIDINQL
ncbi:hypothetical protein MWH25_00260 [Natroniella acetigena]|uniref:hypothetical protein n=1 Tax=Natroniella acetigena TaxID=52004 RepID=UPI002009DE76|nr:hypothetical protein [Natroniella acetigena]MCK8826180.1 hypothetical protein [Natroniella acetigena]